MEFSDNLINKTLKLSMIISMVFMLIGFVISKNIVISAVTLFATIIAISGFLLSIKFLDRFLERKKGKGPVFFVFFLKLCVITLGFYPVSKISEIAVLFYIAGISVVALSLMIYGILQIFKFEKTGLKNINKELIVKGR